MTDTVEPTATPTQPRWAGPWFAIIWLFYLVSPLAQAVRDHHPLGAIATIAFAACYIAIWVRARAVMQRRTPFTRPPLPEALVSLLVLGMLGLAMVAFVGAKGLAAAVYIAVSGVLLLPLPLAAGCVALLLFGTLGAGIHHGWDQAAGVGVGIVAASVAVFGVRTVVTRNMQLMHAHEKNAELAVENERTRFARDLHDILGHSLTVITVKAELAQRLIDVDPIKARAELADLERLSRDALADVRRAVRGYRELTLPNELARARQALTAASIEPVLPQSTDEVPTELRELFAWTVREGITNVLRHSQATRCEIALSPTQVEVRDNGRGCEDEGSGTGLTGLRERAASVGGTVTTRNLSPGFALQVSAGEVPA
jgi:two-component system sensor histidine kinase DesK